MGWLSPDKERDRFYLLPGMGGRAMRRKRNAMLVWALIAGFFVSVLFAAVIYWVHSRGFAGS